MKAVSAKEPSTRSWITKNRGFSINDRAAASKNRWIFIYWASVLPPINSTSKITIFFSFLKKGLICVQVQRHNKDRWIGKK
jgi:hypothetical protein